MSKQNTVSVRDDVSNSEAVVENTLVNEAAVSSFTNDLIEDDTLCQVMQSDNKKKKISRTIYLCVKRLLDIIVSLFGLLVFIAVFPFVSAAILIESRGNPLFFQERIGKDGRCFRIIKFRSMYCENDNSETRKCGKNGFSQTEFDPRVTKVGRILRNFSIDELPQFINVLKGDMSLIGPRPFIPSETWQLSKNHIRRLNVRPGITGLAQINGRSNASLEQREEWDLYYIDNIGPWLDLKIFLATFWVVISKRDVL